MSPNDVKKINKQYLEPSYNRHRVSRRTKERWRLIFKKSREHSTRNKDHNHCISFTANNSRIDLSTDYNNQSPDSNNSKITNFAENEAPSYTEISGSESSSDDSDSSSDQNDNYLSNNHHNNL